MLGKVTFVGAGSGDARLITTRAVEVLANADFVLYDPEVHPDVLARVRDGAPRHPVNASMTVEVIAALLADQAKRGKSAVRLTWADPLLFGSADVEAVAVSRRGAPLEVVPGIGPLVAVGAFAGVPLTRSNDASPSVAAVTVTRGHESLHDWSKLSTATDMLAIVCDAEAVAETARSLVFYGRVADDKVTVIENVSLPSQRVIETTLGELPLLPRARAQRVVLVVGERATPLSELRWFESQPLFGKRVLVTRAKEQAPRAAELLRERGADPVIVPTIEIHPPSDPSAMIDAVGAMDAATGGRWGWIVFTSANGVERLWAEMRRQNKDARTFGGAKVAAIGPGTAVALERIGVAADLVPKEHRGEALAAELLAQIGDQMGDATSRPRVLVARAEVARDVLPDTLRAAGCDVDVVPVYKTRAPPRAILEALAALLDGGDIDVVTFTSSSTVDHLYDALGAPARDLLAKAIVACIGPITADTARKRGLRVDVVAADYTISGLLDALEKHFEKR